MYVLKSNNPLLPKLKVLRECVCIHYHSAIERTAMLGPQVKLEI